MILELATLRVRPGQSAAYEAAFAQAAPIIAASPGCLGYELHKCIEVEDQYILLVRWETLEAHTVGFRGSPAYQEWRRLLHPFYDPPATVEHYTLVHSE